MTIAHAVSDMTISRETSGDERARERLSRAKPKALPFTIVVETTGGTTRAYTHNVPFQRDIADGTLRGGQKARIVHPQEGNTDRPSPAWSTVREVAKSRAEFDTLFRPVGPAP